MVRFLFLRGGTESAPHRLRGRQRVSGKLISLRLCKLYNQMRQRSIDAGKLF
jgi:hypothetical protein